MIIYCPPYNQPTDARCSRCGGTFVKPVYGGAYSAGNGSLVTLCTECAAEALRQGRVGRILY